MKVQLNSVEYVRATISAEVAGVKVDPTEDAVRVAFVPFGEHPAEEDWVAGDWETNNAGRTPVYYARGLYTASEKAVLGTFFEIEDVPEKVILFAGKLEVV